MNATPDNTLADPDQRIADLERQLAERDAELAEALQRETATAEVLQAINSSPGDLTPVFDAILEKAHSLCGAPLGSLVLRDGDQLRAVATRGYPQEYETLARQGFPPTGSFRLLLGGEPFRHVLDSSQPPTAFDNHPMRRAAAEIAGVRTVLFVPLRKDETVLGYISAQRQEVRPFTDRQIALFQSFAAQAVIAMENARLLTETREALEQQTATAEVLQVINSLPGDLTPVFDAMLEKAMRLCGAAFGSLYTYDGERFHSAAQRGVPPAYAAYRAENPPLLSTPGGAPALLLETRRPLHVLDLRLHETNRPDFPNVRAMVELGGIRTSLAVPLIKDDAFLGMITIFRQEVRAFSDKQIALLENFASQAVIAIENARLLTETREALEQQTATAEVLGVINSSPGDLAPVFDAIIEKAMRLCEAAHGHLLTYDGESLRPAAMRGDPRYVEWVRQFGPIRPPPNVSPLGRIITGERIVHVADIRKEANSPQHAEIGGIRSYLCVALRKDDALLGTLSVYRQEVRPFTDKQIALLESFAAQAVIAMENARLLTEQREALEQQTATAEVLQVINSSPGDLAPVFDAMLEKAMRLCEAAFGSLHIRDGDSSRSVAHRGVPRAYAEFRANNPPIPQPGSILARTFETRRAHQVVDLMAGELYRAGNPNTRAMVELGGVRTILVVPLCKDEDVLGHITVYRQEVRAFSDKQIALLENFAAQAVIAMESARLLTETREALEQQTATAEVLQVINSSPGDLAPVFEAMLEKATRLCEAPFGNLRTWDGERFHFGAVYGDRQFSDWVRRRGPLLPDRDDDSPLGQILKGEQVVRFTVAPGDEGRWTSAGFKEMVEISGMRSGIAVALNKDGALLGTISVYRQEVRPFSDKQIGLLQNFAAQAVIAIENARLLGELQHRTEEVAELNRGLEARVTEQVEELGRIGRLKRFLAPQLAELIVSQGNEKILESHRREIVVVFCDLRGYTAFTETAEPEEVLDFLRDYHGTLGPLVAQFEGTLDQFSGDGIMVFFNDPVPIPDPAARAVNMAVAMRGAAATLIADWRERGRDLGFGVGIAQGYATLGQIGFSERSGYTAIGTVCNVAARLCAEARDGQILLSQRINAALRGSVVTEQVGALALRGLTQPVVAYNVPLAGSQAAFRVIEGGPPSA